MLSYKSRHPEKKDLKIETCRPKRSFKPRYRCSIIGILQPASPYLSGHREADFEAVFDLPGLLVGAGQQVLQQELVLGDPDRQKENKTHDLLPTTGQKYDGDYYLIIIIYLSIYQCYYDYIL